MNRVPLFPLFLCALLSLLLSSCRTRRAPAARQVRDGDADLGPRAMVRYGCGGCHIIPGIDGAKGRVAPPLTAFSERAFIAGVLSNTPENLIAWIRFPRDIEPRSAMPNLGVTEADARDIAAYLYTLAD